MGSCGTPLLLVPAGTVPYPCPVRSGHAGEGSCPVMSPVTLSVIVIIGHNLLMAGRAGKSFLGGRYWSGIRTTDCKKESRGFAARLRPSSHAISAAEWRGGGQHKYRTVHSAVRYSARRSITVQHCSSSSTVATTSMSGAAWCSRAGHIQYGTRTIPAGPTSSLASSSAHRVVTTTARNKTPISPAIICDVNSP